MQNAGDLHTGPFLWVRKNNWTHTNISQNQNPNLSLEWDWGVNHPFYTVHVLFSPERGEQTPRFRWEQTPFVWPHMLSFSEGGSNDSWMPTMLLTLYYFLQQLNPSWLKILEHPPLTPFFFVQDAKNSPNIGSYSWVGVTPPLKTPLT